MTKCDHVYRGIRCLAGTTRGTLVDHRGAGGHPNLYRCLVCHRIMRKSRQGRYYYVRCGHIVEETPDGYTECGQYAVATGPDPHAMRRTYRGQPELGWCAEHAPPRPKKKPDREIVLITRKNDMSETEPAKTHRLPTVEELTREPKTKVYQPRSGTVKVNGREVAVTYRGRKEKRCDGT